MTGPRSVTLLGPQRLRSTVATALRSLRVKGPVAVVTAGWQEREEEDQELSDHLGGRTLNLGLYRRALEVFREDPELAAALRGRQRALQQLQRLYRLRLAHALDAVRELRTIDGGDSEHRAAAEAAAMRAVQALDAEHLVAVGEIHHGFDVRWQPSERDSVVRHHAEIAAAAAEARVLAIAGGHVAVLLNRMRLFSLSALFSDRHLIGWSAGAMVLGERVVLFHDNPPQGPANAELLESGLAAYRGLVPFPNARRRLHLHDAGRVTLLSRRFEPDQCVALDEGSRLEWRPTSGWRPGARVRRLRLDGGVERMVAP